MVRILLFLALAMLLGCAGESPAPATCLDGSLNAGETDVDCGGACGPCTPGRSCDLGSDCTSTICLNSVCLAATCDDGVLNGKETAVDCGGGVCAPCVDGLTCLGAWDCESGVCTDGSCSPGACTDGVQNARESDVDCGGPCEGCADGGSCVDDEDCGSGACIEATCVDPTCTDGLSNGTETGLDCGGDCPGCGSGQACTVPDDCADGVCEGGSCQLPTCADGVANGDETGLDCGGRCPGCDLGAPCTAPGDCASGTCAGGECAAATCVDHLQDGLEVAVDCGGPDCPGCAPLSPCVRDEDCAEGVCTGGTCAAADCLDGVPNGDETGLDCGGSCAPCPLGSACEIGADCIEGVCDGTCAPPTCGDGVRNGSELAVDCGGPCRGCGAGVPCDGPEDCASHLCNGVCAQHTCIDDLQNGAETWVDCGGGECDPCPAYGLCEAPADCLEGLCEGGVCHDVDDEPDPFTFQAAYAHASGIVVSSNTVVLTGFLGSQPVVVTGQPGVRLVVDGTEIATSTAQVEPGTTLAVRATSPATRGQSVSLSVTVGTSSTSWTVHSGPLRMGPAGGQPDGASIYGQVSDDGRYVAFMSAATNLVAGDDNGRTDAFVLDAQTGSIVRASVGTSGAESNGHSSYPDVSADGRYVAFQSTASNLASEDTNAQDDIFARDLLNGTTTLVSIGSSGSQGSTSPLISPDGRYVSFWSDVGNIVSGDTNGGRDVFRHDRQTGETLIASVNDSGQVGNGASHGWPALTADGERIVFYSQATNLVSGDTNGVEDVFLHDFSTGTTSRMGQPSGAQSNGGASSPFLSSDGRYLTFESTASNLVTGDTNGVYDIFVQDLQTGAIERVSVSSSGTEANGPSRFSDISGDGRFVVFTSEATNLVAEDTHGFNQVFVHDRARGTTRLLSVATDGSGANNDVYYRPNVSRDGRWVVYSSYATDLVPGQNSVQGVYLVSVPQE